MQDVTELLFKVVTQDDLGLDRVNEAVKKIASASGLAGKALEVVEGEVKKAFDGMAASGLNFEQIIRRLGQSANQIGKEPAAAARELKKELDAAATAAKNLADRQRDLRNAGSGLQNALANPLAAAATAAIRAASAIGPVGLAIAGVATIATFGGKALLDFVGAQGQAAQETVNMARQLGLSNTQMRELQVEARISGIGLQNMQMVSSHLAVALEDASGSGRRASQSLRGVGISLQDSSGTAREEGQVFLDVIETLGKVSSQTQRVATETEIFGSRGARSVEILIQRHKELADTLGSLGYSNVDQLIAEEDKAAQSINKMSEAWKLFKDRLAEQIGPIVIPVVTKLTGLLKPSIKDDKWELAAKDREWDKTNTVENNLDQSAGKAIVDRFQANRRNTDDGRKAFLADIDDKLKKALDVIAKGGLDKKTAQEQTGLVAGLEGQKRSIQEAQQRSRQAESERRRLTEETKFPGLSSPIEFQKLLAERSKELDLLGVKDHGLPQALTTDPAQLQKLLIELITHPRPVGPGDKGLVDASDKFGFTKIVEAMVKFFGQIGERGQKEAEKTVRDVDRDRFQLQTKSFQKDNKDQLAISEAQFSESQKQLRLINGGDRDTARREQSRAVRLAELQGGNNGELAAVNLGTQSRVSSANDVRADALRQVKDLEDSINASVGEQGKRSVDDEKQLAQLGTRRLEIEQEYWKEIGDARLDQELKIAELQKRQLDEYKQEGLSIFEALQRPNGLRDFLKGQTNQLLGGIFSNVTAPILQKAGQALGGLIPGQTDASGNKTALGKIFAGTKLDSDRAATPQIKAVDTNTAALNKLTATLSGTTVGGQASTVTSGSPADVLASAAKTGAAAGNVAKTLGAAPGVVSDADGIANDSGGIGGFFSSIKKLFTGSGSALSRITKAAGAGLGIYESANQFSKGGASGLAGGIGAAATTAGTLAGGPTNPVGGILDAIGLSAEVFKALLPDPKEIRQAQIANQTAYNTYQAPPVLDRNLSSHGFETFSDKYGKPEVSNFSSIQETQPYKYLDPTTNMNNGFLGGLFGNGSLYQKFVNAPGQVIEPYQAPPERPSYAGQAYGTGTTFNLTVNALDSKSVLDRSGDIATAVQKEVRAGHPVGLALQQSLVGT